MISGPMPSPGRTATFTLEVPGMLRFAPRLELADLVRVAQREAGLVEDELRVLAPLGEQALREAGALDRGEVLLRDDLVGVDVGAIERRHDPIQHRELVHR